MCRSCSRSLKSAPWDSRCSPSPRAMLGSASLMSRSSRPLRSFSPKVLRLTDPTGQPAVSLQRLRG